jgi:putative SOS response-associated peptidase YedK
MIMHDAGWIRVGRRQANPTISIRASGIAPSWCGCYASFLPAEAIARIFGTVNPLPNLAPSWNVAPTQGSAIVRRHPDTGDRHLDLLKWGLLPHWTKEPTRAQRPINARSETAAKSSMFRGALSQRRCIVPADAFYEWKVAEGGKRRTRSLVRTGSRWRSPACGRASAGRTKR